MSDLDSNEDNIVRYGTQLEPYEEDHTSTMPRTRISNASKKRLKKLISLNVSYKKAIQISHLPWSEICKRMPGIETNVPKQYLSRGKKSKKKKANQRSRRESQSGVCDPNQESHWRQICKETSMESRRLKQEPAEVPQKRLWIKNDLQECSRKKRSDLMEQPYMVKNATWPNRALENSSKAKFSAPNLQNAIIPMEYTSQTNSLQSDRQLNYIDYTDSLHVKVHNGIRAVKRHRNDSESDEKPYLEHHYKVPKTSLLVSSEINAWEPGRPSKEGLRNEMHPFKHTPNESKPDEIVNWGQPYKIEKTSVHSGSEVNWESDRTSHIGLQIEEHQIKPGLDCIESNETYCWNQPQNVQNMLLDNSPQLKHGNPNYLLRDGLPNNMYSIKYSPSENVPDEIISWRQFHEDQKKYSNGPVQQVYGNANRPSPAEFQSDTQSMKRSLNDIEPDKIIYSWSQIHKERKMAERESPQLVYGNPNLPTQTGFQNDRQSKKYTSDNVSNERTENQLYGDPNRTSFQEPIKHDPNESNEISWSHKMQKSSLNNYTQMDYGDSDRPSRIGLRNETHPLKCSSSRTMLYNEQQSYRDFHTYEGNADHSPRETAGSLLRNDVTGKEDHPRDPRETFPKENVLQKPTDPRRSFSKKNPMLNKARPVRLGIYNTTLMTKEQMSLVHRAINQAIVQIGVQGAGPKFLVSTHKLGWILMICENHASKNWLENEIPKLKPWPDAKLYVMPPKEFSKQIQASIHIPSKEAVTAETALELLRVQNPGLDTERWKVLNNIEIDTGNIVHLSLDAQSYEALKRIKYRASLGMGKITFKIKSHPQNSHTRQPIKSGNKLTEIAIEASSKASRNPLVNSAKTPSDGISYPLSLSTDLKDKSFVNHAIKNAPLKAPLQKFVRERKASCSIQTETEEKRLVKSPPSKKWYPKAEESSTSQWSLW